MAHQPNKTPPERQARLQAEFAAHLRDPENSPPPTGIEERRLAIYRRLFFGNLRNLMARNFPVLRRMLDDLDWDRLIRELMVRHRATTPLFPEIGSELLRFMGEAREHWLADRPWMVELIHWEYLETLARLHDAEVPEPVLAQSPRQDYVPVLNPTLQMARYHWPVHQISPDFVPLEPLGQPLNLLVYRQHDDQVAFERVNDFTLQYLLLMKAKAGSTAFALLGEMAQGLNVSPADQMIEAGFDILVYLGQREVITPLLPPDISAQVSV